MARISYCVRGRDCILGTIDLIGENLDVIIRLDAIPSNGVVAGDDTG